MDGIRSFFFLFPFFSPIIQSAEAEMVTSYCLFQFCSLYQQGFSLSCHLSGWQKVPTTIKLMQCFLPLLTSPNVLQNVSSIRSRTYSHILPSLSSCFSSSLPEIGGIASSLWISEPFEQEVMVSVTTLNNFLKESREEERSSISSPFILSRFIYLLPSVLNGQVLTNQ